MLDATERNAVLQSDIAVISWDRTLRSPTLEAYQMRRCIVTTTPFQFKLSATFWPIVRASCLREFSGLADPKAVVVAFWAYDFLIVVAGTSRNGIAPSKGIEPRTTDLE